MARGTEKQEQTAHKERVAAIMAETLSCVIVLACEGNFKMSFNPSKCIKATQTLQLNL